MLSCVWMWAFLSAHSLEIANLSKTINNIHTRFDILQHGLTYPDGAPKTCSISILGVGIDFLERLLRNIPDGASILIIEFDVFNGLQCKSQCLYQL